MREVGGATGASPVAWKCTRRHYGVGTLLGPQTTLQSVVDTNNIIDTPYLSRALRKIIRAYPAESYPKQLRPH